MRARVCSHTRSLISHTHHHHSEEMAGLVAQLRSQCEGLHVQLAEAQRQGNDWKLTAEMESTALLRAGEAFALERQVLAKAAQGSQSAGAVHEAEEERKAAEQEEARKKMMSEGQSKLRTAAECVRRFELEDKRLRVALSKQQHELRLCRAHLVRLVHASAQAWLRLSVSCCARRVSACCLVGCVLPVLASLSCARGLCVLHPICLAWSRSSKVSHTWRHNAPGT